MDGPALQQRITNVLIKQVREETFPSVPMMNRIEPALQTREELEDYAETLLEKVESTRYPSISMLDRLDSIAARLGTAPESGSSRE